MIRETYRAKAYVPERVTGRYVRREKDHWKVCECASGTGRFAGKPGQGPTLREYVTDGEGLPDGFRPTWAEGTVSWPAS